MRAARCLSVSETGGCGLVTGLQYPMEAQITASIPQATLSTCPAAGCQVGISVLYELFDDPTAINLFLDSLIPYIPYNGAVHMHIPALCCFLKAALSGHAELRPRVPKTA